MYADMAIQYAFTYSFIIGLNTIWLFRLLWRIQSIGYLPKFNVIDKIHCVFFYHAIDKIHFVFFYQIVTVS